MPHKKRAMTSKQASERKLGGHKTEERFADIIGGEVNKGEQTNKKDVVDEKHRTHSVKGGTFWQMFLYARSRFETNTAFKGTGDLAKIMIACLDAFPEQFEEYKRDKSHAKAELQKSMRKLCEELKKPNLFASFLDKAIFNGGEVNYLSVLPSKDEPVFHVFAQQDVVRVLSEHLTIENSRAQNNNQTDALKVVLKLKVNFGEIEVRVDSPAHYRQLKFRLKAPLVTNLLMDHLSSQVITPNVCAYGEAIKSLKWLHGDSDIKQK